MRPQHHKAVDTLTLISLIPLLFTAFVPSGSYIQSFSRTKIYFYVELNITSLTLKQEMAIYYLHIVTIPKLVSNHFDQCTQNIIFFYTIKAILKMCFSNNFSCSVERNRCRSSNVFLMSIVYSLVKYIVHISSTKLPALERIAVSHLIERFIDLQ